VGPGIKFIPFTAEIESTAIPLVIEDEGTYQHLPRKSRNHSFL
jgi:hypothetical protein